MDSKMDLEQPLSVQTARLNNYQDTDPNWQPLTVDFCQYQGCLQFEKKIIPGIIFKINALSAAQHIDPIKTSHMKGGSASRER